MCAIVGKLLMSAYMHEKNLGQLPVLTSLAMTTGAILCRWYVVSPWTCHRAEHPSSSSSPHLVQVSVSVSVSVSASKYRYRNRFLVSVTALESTHLVFCPPFLRVSRNWAWRLTSGSLPGSILNTCPSQVCCLFITMYDMKFSLWLVRSQTSLLGMWSDQ